MNYFWETLNPDWHFGWRITASTDRVAKSRVDIGDGVYVHCVNYHY